MSYTKRYIEMMYERGIDVLHTDYIYPLDETYDLIYEEEDK